MSSPFKQSIKPIGPNRWHVGSLVCERIKTMPPEDAIAAWAEDDCTYILRTPKDGDIASSPFTEASDAIQVVQEGGTLSVVWTIGREVFCKIKEWVTDMESEENTIHFIKKVAPQISTPDVIDSWTERDRSFLLLRRIEGSTLRDALASLSPSQRVSVVKTIAMYCNLLAQNTSPVLRSVTGKPVLEPYLALSDEPGLLGPYTLEECRRYFSAPSADCLKLEGDYRFYHADLGPGNIIVSDNGSIAGILDWEIAGYLPNFWIATKPSVSPGLDFCPSVAGSKDYEWRKCLRMELETWRYPQASQWYMKWRTLRRTNWASSRTSGL